MHAFMRVILEVTLFVCATDFHAVSKTTPIRHIVRCSILNVGKKGKEIVVTNLNPSSKIGVIAL